MMVLDLMMPNPDGMDVLRALRSKPETSSLPILVITASNDPLTASAGFEVGATDYLTKPFSVPQLRARVRACLARALRHREHQVDCGLPLLCVFVL